MSKWEKLLEKIRSNPKAVTFEEVNKALPGEMAPSSELIDEIIGIFYYFSPK